MPIEIVPDLVTIGGAWRIADVHGPRVSSLMNFLGSTVSASSGRR